MRYKTSLLLMALGVWLSVAPGTFGYLDTPTGDAGVWMGIVLALSGFLAAKTGKKGFATGALLLGVLLQFVPLVFWATQPVAYLNTTITGLLTILTAFSFPGISDEGRNIQANIPEGWSFNPSEWTPRIITVSLALICWCLARYMSAYQLGYISEVYDPFFGTGTTRVITSDIARSFPISDAGLGALVYSLEFLLGWVGSDARWKTMPWLAGIFSLMVVPAGVTSIFLIISQPVLVGAWCGLCLVTAACMLVMVVLTIPEMCAVAQLLYSAKKNGLGFWRVFWRGIDNVGVEMPADPVAREGLSRFGFTCPWNLILSIGIGAWLMLSPYVLGMIHPVSDIVYVAGPLIITFSVLSLSELAKNFRFVNTALGLVILIIPFFMDEFTFWGVLSSFCSGTGVFLLSLPKREVRERYGKK